jgi:hypothetical protein
MPPNAPATNRQILADRLTGLDQGLERIVTNEETLRTHFYIINFAVANKYIFFTANKSIPRSTLIHYFFLRRPRNHWHLTPPLAFGHDTASLPIDCDSRNQSRTNSAQIVSNGHKLPDRPERTDWELTRYRLRPPSL